MGAGGHSQGEGDRKLVALWQTTLPLRGWVHVGSILIQYLSSLPPPSSNPSMQPTTFAKPITKVSLSRFVCYCFMLTSVVLWVMKFHNGKYDENPAVFSFIYEKPSMVEMAAYDIHRS